MPAKVYTDKDADLSVLQNKTLAVLGFGSQGHAHALNLKDSGLNVIVGLYEGSKSIPVAREKGFEVYPTGEAVRRAATEPEKWDPRTRETADHSIPFLVAAALQDGGVTPATFAPARIQDPALRPLIAKLTVVEEPEFTRRYPGESRTRVELEAADGRRIAAETAYPKGHRGNPMTDAEVEDKFRALVSGRLAEDRCGRLLAEAWRLEDAVALDELLDATRVA